MDDRRNLTFKVQHLCIVSPSKEYINFISFMDDENFCVKIVLLNKFCVSFSENKKLSFIIQSITLEQLEKRVQSFFFDWSASPQGSGHEKGGVHHPYLI